jgi:hypothetical protein
LAERKTIESKVEYLRQPFLFGHTVSAWAAGKLGELDDPRAIELLKQAAADPKHPAFEQSRWILHKRGIVKVKAWEELGQ